MRRPRLLPVLTAIAVASSISFGGLQGAVPRLGPPAVDAAAELPAPSGTAVASAVYRFNAYTASGSGGTFVNQPDSCTCVAASAQAWINKITGTQYQSAATVWRRFAWARPYTQYICRLYDSTGKMTKAGVATASYGTYNPSAAGYTRYKYSARNPGLDPRAFAWIVYNFTPAGMHFNDYWLNAVNDGSLANAQRDMDASFVKNLRITGRPAGAILGSGSHAVLVTGFQSDVDPLTANYNLLGFYVWDPYNNVLGHDYGTGYLGQTFFTLSNWKTNQFKPYRDPQYTKDNPGKYVIWEKDPRNGGGPSYVGVFQTSDTSTTVEGPPTDNPPNSIGYVRWKGGGPKTAGLETPAVAAAPASVSAAHLLTAAIGRGDLVSESVLPAHRGGSVASAALADLAALGFGADSPLGDLRGVAVGRQIHVDSAVAGHTPYWLVSLERGGRTVAVATVDETPDGLRLGSVTAAGPDYRLPDPAAVRSAAVGHGVAAASVAATFVAASRSELDPAWTVTDGTGRRTVLASDGSPVR